MQQVPACSIVGTSPPLAATSPIDFPHVLYEPTLVSLRRPEPIRDLADITSQHGNGTPGGEQDSIQGWL
eukprot:6288897-Pyramimonas_sp.AAC.1